MLNFLKRKKTTLNRDFSLNSGERQTAAELSGIRADHSTRYRFAAEQIRKPFGDCRECVGLDMFCGVGYGSFILQTTLDCSIIGIEGSSEAVDMANSRYATASTFYVAKIFPFVLPSKAYDFVVSIESLEHLSDYEKMFRTIAHSLKDGGILVLSTPNESLLPFNQYKHDFADHHVRHFTVAEIESLARDNNLTVQAIFGQDIYELGTDRVLRLREAEELTVRTGEGQLNLYVLEKISR